jgi:hypothetical protein
MYREDLIAVMIMSMTKKYVIEYKHSLKLERHIYFCVAGDGPLPKARVILSSRYAAINGFTHVSRRVSALLMNKVRPTIDK